MNLPLLKSTTGDDPVVVEAKFKAPVAKVFAAWTEAELMKQWFGSDENGPEFAEVEAREGGRWECRFAESDGVVDCLSGHYLRVEKNRLLEFTWVHTRRTADGEEKSGESVVTVEFESRGAESFTRLVHKAISAEGSRRNIGGGWNNSLAKLQKLVA